MKPPKQPLWNLLQVLCKPHPWHGIFPGDHAPGRVNCFIEVVPADTVKYEIDKLSGYLKVDRPQKYSNICPALYGFLPQSYCGEKVAAYSSAKAGKHVEGDRDPLDVCVLTDRPITHGNIIVECVPIGGFRMLDGGEADDKIIAVLKGDATYGHCEDISQVPSVVLDRLRHYFLTYKLHPGASGNSCEIHSTYGREEALEVISLSFADYDSMFGNLEDLLNSALELFKR